jgi:hypothetical protein
MAIKSVFLPDNALQGEDIPSFVLWSNIDFDQIIVKKHDCCKLKEIYNVSEGAYEIFDNQIVVNSVEDDGYLGLVLESIRSESILVEAGMSYCFMKHGKCIVKSEHNIVLFRPELEVKHAPKSLTIKDGRIISRKIELQNIGEGTCNLVFKTSDNSEIKLTQPKRLREFLQSFTSTFNEEVYKIKTKYSDYTWLFEDLLFLINSIFDPSNELLMKEMNLRIERLDEALEENESLWKDVIRVYSLSIMKNISLITVLEQFINYLKSIEKNRVKLVNSLDSIQLKQGYNYIELELHYTDLLLSKMPPIKLDQITIISDAEADLSIYSLFDWDGGQ